MGKLPFPSQLPVFEGTALTSVGFLHRYTADYKDKFDLQSEMHGNMILACLQFLYTGKGLKQGLQDDGKMVLLHTCIWGNSDTSLKPSSKSRDYHEADVIH